MSRSIHIDTYRAVDEGRSVVIAVHVPEQIIAAAAAAVVAVALVIGALLYLNSLPVPA